nr:MAG TPA: hypothetical protein [Crassvirales sp.]
MTSGRPQLIRYLLSSQPSDPKPKHENRTKS